MGIDDPITYTVKDVLDGLIKKVDDGFEKVNAKIETKFKETDDRIRAVEKVQENLNGRIAVFLALATVLGAVATAIVLKGLGV